MIVARAGDNLRTLQQESTSCCYTLPRAAIQSQDVEAVVADHGEGWIFDLTRRSVIATLWARLANCRGLWTGRTSVKNLGYHRGRGAPFARRQAAIGRDMRPHWKRGMSYQQFQQIGAKLGSAARFGNPYAEYMCFQRAERFAMAELVGHMESLFDADLRLKSSHGQPRLVMEKLILGMCLARGAIRRKATWSRGDHASPAAPRCSFTFECSVILLR